VQYFCGIDIGASAAKLALIDEQHHIVAKSVRRSGVDYAQTAQRCRDEALAAAGLDVSQIKTAIATGYGRDNVPWVSGKMTEIACHGRGAFHHFRTAITVLDIGAQDSKIIHLDEKGFRTSFKMNRKCAAGTGAFLEEIAYRLDLKPSDLNGLAEQSTREVTLGSFCTVFAATEVLEKIRAGLRVQDIVKGAFRSVVNRVREMDVVTGSLVMTGGVAAYNPALVQLAGEAFGCAITVPPEAQFIGALGAAIYAAEINDPHCPAPPQTVAPSPAR
jgi:(R)-2-hydroxyacyl-CoA dehydratese activating ATPase